MSTQYSSSGRKSKKRVEHCDMEGKNDTICDYDKYGASIISDKVTIPDTNKHLDLVGKALCRRHYNKLIVNAKKIKITNTCSHPKHNIYLSTARKEEGNAFKKAPQRLVNYLKLSDTAVMCHHCLYKSDNDPEYLDSPDYQLPAQKTSNENVQKFQNRTYALRDDIFYSEIEFQQLESAYHEVCAELDEAKLGKQLVFIDNNYI